MSSHQRSHKQQTGFTLVELLVSLTLGATILLATSKLFIESRGSFRYAEQSQELHERGRHAMQFIRSELKKVGYTTQDPIESPIYASNSGENSSLTISYEGGKDCTGSSSSTTKYEISGTNFRCDGSNASPQTLSSHAYGLQINFGIDLDEDGSIDRYLTADQISSWDRVQSVEVALLLRSKQPARQTLDADEYNLLGVSYGPFNDYKLSRIYRSVIELRNR